MSNIIRYAIVSERWGTSFESRLVPSPSGEYVKIKDFERIESERDALCSKLARMMEIIKPHNMLMTHYEAADIRRAVAIAEGES